MLACFRDEVTRAVARRSKRGLAIALGAIPFVAIAALGVLRLVQTSQFAWLGVVLGVAGVILLTLAITAVVSLRLAAVNRQAPDALAVSVLVYPQLVAQLSHLTKLLGLPRHRVRDTRYLSFTLDRSSARIFGGAFRQRELFVAPTSALESVELRRTEQGNFSIASASLTFVAGTDRGTIDVCLVQARWGLLVIASEGFRQRWLQAAQQFVRSNASRKPEHDSAGGSAAGAGHTRL